MESVAKIKLTKTCATCGYEVGLFTWLEREKQANKAMRELMDGCPKHPAYRFKAKPKKSSLAIKGCVCHKLYELYQELLAFEKADKDATAARLKAERLQREEEYRRNEAYYNSHQ